MTGKMIPLALAAVLTLMVPNTVLANDGAGTEEEQAAATAKGERTYTWDELVELIPGLDEMTIEQPRRKAGVPESASVSKERRLCRKETKIGSRIPKRRCYTLEQLVADITESRELYNQIIRGQMTFGMIGDGE
ncbi:MAG: hypothetical protein AAFX85_07595 [Pseudomonadota bacterium]